MEFIYSFNPSDGNIYPLEDNSAYESAENTVICILVGENTNNYSSWETRSYISGPDYDAPARCIFLSRMRGNALKKKS